MSNNYTLTKDELVRTITDQLQEVEILTAMFPEEGGLVWTDPSILIDAEEYRDSEGCSPNCIQCLAFELNLNTEVNNQTNLVFKLSIKLPKDYPLSRPELSVISDQMSREELINIKKALNEFVLTLPNDEHILLEIILWLKDNIGSYYNGDKTSQQAESSKANTEGNTDILTSMWLYMHHIYSKHKRKDILNWSHDFGLTGFSLPGKPGLVYIEGQSKNVEEFFDRLKSLPWKSIQCRSKEDIEKRIFTDFKEMSFDPHGSRDYHMDFGLFYKFLVDHGLGHMFKEIFGIEGQIKDEK
ncbi:RWD domain-containing protein 2B-like [Clytia hemisphaerica]|uniref:RWD domain-containing protein n=1 Tax=Clytia hemisphaerica TaxID=252671 RepID=A0A7M5X5Z9_9CNID|eukprot:TCONS_00017324-protein